MVSRRKKPFLLWVLYFSTVGAALLGCGHSAQSDEGSTPPAATESDRRAAPAPTASESDTAGRGASSRFAGAAGLSPSPATSMPGGNSEGRAESTGSLSPQPAVQQGATARGADQQRADADIYPDPNGFHWPALRSPWPWIALWLAALSFGLIWHARREQQGSRDIENRLEDLAKQIRQRNDIAVKTIDPGEHSESAKFVEADLRGVVQALNETRGWVAKETEQYLEGIKEVAAETLHQQDSLKEETERIKSGFNGSIRKISDLFQSIKKSISDLEEAQRDYAAQSSSLHKELEKAKEGYEARRIETFQNELFRIHDRAGEKERDDIEILLENHGIRKITAEMLQGEKGRLFGTATLRESGEGRSNGEIQITRIGFFNSITGAPLRVAEYDKFEDRTPETSSSGPTAPAAAPAQDPNSALPAPKPETQEKS